MSWGKNADDSSQSLGALSWLGCGSAPPKRRTVTCVAPYGGSNHIMSYNHVILKVRTYRGGVYIRVVNTTAAERWKTALEAVLEAAGLRAMGDAEVERLVAAGCCARPSTCCATAVRRVLYPSVRAGC